MEGFHKNQQGERGREEDSGEFSDAGQASEQAGK
jgi:hypothetical protein